jgi:hypothetical protein
MVDLQGDTPASGMDGLGQRAQAREHLIAVCAQHLGMGFSFGCNIGVPGDDQTGAATRQLAVKLGQGRGGPPDRLGG